MREYFGVVCFLSENKKSHVPEGTQHGTLLASRRGRIDLMLRERRANFTSRLSYSEQIFNLGNIIKNCMRSQQILLILFRL